MHCGGWLVISCVKNSVPATASFVSSKQTLLSLGSRPVFRTGPESKVGEPREQDKWFGFTLALPGLPLPPPFPLPDQVYTRASKSLSRAGVPIALADAKPMPRGSHLTGKRPAGEGGLLLTLPRMPAPRMLLSKEGQSFGVERMC